MTHLDDSKKRHYSYAPRARQREEGSEEVRSRGKGQLRLLATGFSQPPLGIHIGIAGRELFPFFFPFGKKLQRSLPLLASLPLPLQAAEVVVGFSAIAEDQLKFARCAGRLCLAARNRNEVRVSQKPKNIINKN